MNDKNSMRVWLPLGIYCLLILVQAFLPLPVVRLRHADKLVHFAAYAVLGILLFRALSSLKPDKDTWRTVFIAVLLASLIGFCDEIIQAFIPNRSVDREDLVFDILGSFSGVLLYLGSLRLRGKKDGGPVDRTDGEGG